MKRPICYCRLLACAALASRLLACAALETAPASDAAVLERALKDLDSGDWIIQWEAVHDLAERRAEQAAPKLEALLTDKNKPWLRAEALIALAGIRKDSASAKALEFSKDASPALRASAMKTLGLIGAESALPAIENGLRDSDPGVRGEALVAFAKIAGERAWPALKESLAGAEPQPAIRALPYIDSPEAKLKLLSLLESKDRGTRLALFSSLKEARNASLIKPLGLRLGKESERVMQDAVVAALGAVDPQLRTPILLELLEAGETQALDSFLDLLAASPGTDVSDRIEKLVPRIETESPLALPRVFRFLSSRGADRYAAVFTARLQHAKPEIRLAAIEALGRCKKNDRFQLLKPLLTDADPRVSETVFAALRVASRWTPDEGMVGYLSAALQSSNKAIFKNAALLLRDRLAAQEFPKALALLKPNIAGSSDEWREMAISVLALAADPDGARQIAAAQGYVTQWHVIGPFSDKDGESAAEALRSNDIEFDPTKKLKLGDDAEISWGAYDVDRTDGTIELQSVLGDSQLSSGFAIASFKVAKSQPARAVIATDGNVSLWLNGKQLSDGKEKKQTLDVDLLAGANRIFVKVVRADGPRAICRIRLLDKQGAAIEAINLH